MDNNNKIKLEVRVRIGDIEESLKTAEDNAWEHAKDSMASMNIDMGDDEFGFIFQELSKRYNHNVEHIQFFMMTALLMVRTLEENKMMTVFTEGEPLYMDDVKTRIAQVANLLLNSYMWLVSGYELTWLTNDELPEQVIVSFDLDEDKIIDKEEDYE